uniref:Uncharacterized protein n=1 Tax=Caenorhabditis tropicalis TaxID=1561998 RepID=A0A1I7T2Y7_9PELO
MTRPQQPRIDLNHGYMQFIRRNQLDRDEFNRVHEQRKSEIRERFSDDQKTINVFEQAKRSNVYIPPHLRRQYKEIEEKRAEAAAMLASTCRSDSDSQEDEKLCCPIAQKQRDADDRVRRQVRRRIERTHPTVDDICISLANYSLEEEDLNGDENLFTLELTLKNGEQKTFYVQRNTKAARLAKSISRENDFNDSQCRNLRLFIEEQLEIRLAREKKQRTRLTESMPTSPTSSTASSASSSASSSSSSIPFAV